MFLAHKQNDVDNEFIACTTRDKEVETAMNSASYIALHKQAMNAA